MDGGYYPNRDGEPVLPQPGRAGGGISGGGVDPLGKHWKYAVNDGAFVAGTISEGEPNERIVEIYCAVIDGEQKTCVISPEGQIIAGIVTVGNLGTLIKEAAESAFNYQFADVAFVIKGWSKYNYVPDWDTYELIS